ncbi:dual specificity tyrosine-phosphorylation-regulated kinase 4-like [Anoplopoma fimbria]|uniref:dual specificity tyrosine-phosphorylation-regulated kinase 4-like n=1 Tax=Anoplopoma fimbria TaxID=229290 RepID=UPI0023ED9333|nr:dual specificity tyrosine-phosphorylation-regulated kinase 4-like [Anoplopoma fimbria]
MKVLGVPPMKLLVEAPKRDIFFYSDGTPLRIKEIACHRSTLVQHLNTKKTCFLRFIERCLEYDPTKRITPEEALKHPWIRKVERTKPVMSAGRTRSDALLPSSGKKPALLQREKMPPLQLQPIRKTNAKKGVN